jgi:predicted MPP superfamily phosphohydrolase
MSHGLRWFELAGALGATALIWLVVVNRWLLHLTDGPPKTLTLGLSLIVLLGLAAVVGRFVGWSTLAFAIVGVLLLGEAHRSMLRTSYQAQDDAAPMAPWLSTTALEVRRFRVPVAGWETGGLRVAQLSDLHFTEALPFQYYLDALREVELTQPDILLLTGDFVSTTEALPLLERWAPLAVAAAPRVYFTLGNHDYWTAPQQITSILEAAGAVSLSGKSLTPTTPAGAVELAGTDAPWGPGLPATSASPRAKVRIVASHTPDNIYDLQQWGATVVMSGHNHGGQLRIPMLGPIVIPSRYGRRFDRGQFQVGGTTLIVSSGVGASGPPLRSFCRPDVVILELQGTSDARPLSWVLPGPCGSQRSPLGARC